jgi:hypothetical protein
LVGEDPDAKTGLDQPQPAVIRERSGAPAPLSRFPTTRRDSRHLAGAYALLRDGLVCPAGGVMKNNVKIALVLAAALALFLLVKIGFPLTGGR